MSHDFLADRRKALEEAFFAKQDVRLIERLRAERERSLAMAALRSASTIEDPDLLGRLVDLGIDARSWTALALVPLVEVAWADGSVEPKERDAILAMAREHGVMPDSPGEALLEDMLTRRPEPAVFAAWGGYVTELASHFTPVERAAMRERLVERARKVARAAGGLLGIASISEAEKRVIAALEKPFA
jgi:tellurite resistance protein TerB